eukprot:NODE_582_length_5738_cov_0.811314.p6 type:complete len:114 gc:universal NODE_582_length_5738_cov_0.811314:2061-2402(+)
MIENMSQHVSTFTEINYSDYCPTNHSGATRIYSVNIPNPSLPGSYYKNTDHSSIIIKKQPSPTKQLNDIKIPSTNSDYKLRILLSGSLFIIIFAMVLIFVILPHFKILPNSFQ